MVFYTIGSRGTVSGPSEFDAEAAAKKLYEGMKGLGTDENVIVDVIGTHTNEQRQEIKDKYKTMYGKELTEELEGELGGSFAKLVLALLKLPEEYIIECVHDSIAGLGTDEYSLIGLLSARSNDELEEIKAAYKEKYESDMEADVKEDLSGNFRSLMVGLINGGRDESDEVDEEKVKEDAKNLFEASQGAGTSEEVYQSIFNTRSYPHMVAVFEAFKEVSDGKDIEDTIKSEFSGSIQTAYLTLAVVFRNVNELYAERLREAIKGAGTDDQALIQIIVTRSEIDMQDIMATYQEKYESSILEDVSSDTSGDYRLLLQKILTLEEASEEAAAEEADAVEVGADAEEGGAEGDEEGGDGEGAAENGTEDAPEEQKEEE